MKYRKIGHLGDGAYAKVYEAEEKHSKKKYAIKRALVSDDEKGDFVLSIKEIDLLKRFNHPNIIPITNVVYGNPFTSKLSPLEKEYRDDKVYIVFPKADHDGSKLAKNVPSLAVRKRAIVGFLLGIRYMHRQGTIHRDIKPHNALYFAKTNELKISDLGMARDDSPRDIKSPEVVTIWYRCPSVLYENREYNEKIDIWAAACTIFEFICNKPLFPGDDVAEMFKLIFKYLDGSPDKKIIEKVSGRKMTSPLTKITRVKLDDNVPGATFQQKYLHYLSNLPASKIKEFDKCTSAKYSSYLDLLEHMLKFDPNERYSIDQVLSHPFFAEYKDIIDKDSRDYPIPEPHIVLFAKKRKLGIAVINTLLNNFSVKERKFNAIRFQCIDLIDRVLLADEKYRKENDQPELTDDLVKMYSFVCFYIILKYLDPKSLDSVMSIAELIGELKEYESSQYEEVEAYIVKTLLDYRVYRKTVYELTTKDVSKREVDSIYKVMCNCESISGRDIEDIYNIVMDVIKQKNKRPKIKDKLNV
jgi:serine/threonine protein kinase